MNFNKYNEVINGTHTYKEIARLLLENKSVGIGWTDESQTHLDIIFKLGITKINPFQRGIEEDCLYVSIIDYTSYAFNIENEKMGNYIQEKLRMNNECGDKLKDLINGIIKQINSKSVEETKIKGE